MKLRAILIAGLLLCAGPARAAVVPDPGPEDPRIHVTTYDPNEVVELNAALGYEIAIEFDPQERIENVAIGDALGWQLTPNRKGDLLFVKPMQMVAATNMTVVTDLRRYTFQLTVRPPPRRAGDASVIYGLRFIYPEPVKPEVIAAAPPPPPPPPQDVNHAYTYAGSNKVLPDRVFDDGHMTYFRFPEGEDFPAIYVLDPAGGEAVVNSFSRAGYVVVDRLAPGIVLRRGKEAATLTNNAFATPVPGPLSPQPAQKKKSGLFR